MFYVNVAAVKLFWNDDNESLERSERVIKIMLGPDPFGRGKIVINYSRGRNGKCVAYICGLNRYSMFLTFL